MNIEAPMSEDLLRCQQIFFARALRITEEVKKQDARFVHYTSAEAAVSIIRNSELWMRKTTVMNDFMEVEHGRECLAAAYHSNIIGARFKMALEAISPGICKEVEKTFDAWSQTFVDNTYIACFSIHDKSEDSYGRLSMWRAYAGGTGVAFVIKNTPFVSISDALKVYSSPVSYLDESGFLHEMESVTNSIVKESEFLKSLPSEILIANIFTMFRFAVLCTKHPGFGEEKEWRAVYNPQLEFSDRIKKDIAVIQGVPQTIMKIPMVSYPDEGMLGAELPELLDHIIIGPTQYPDVIREAFVDMLAAAGVTDANKKVVMSDIPLRC